MSKKILNKTVLKNNKVSRPSTQKLNRDWFVIDASKAPLGRISTMAAKALIGKMSSQYSQDVDMGGVVVVINCQDLVLTGKKAIWKSYFSHTGKPGSLKSISFEEAHKKNPTFAVKHAIKGMLPKNRQQSQRLNHRLKLFAGSEHPFTQQMITLN